MITHILAVVCIVYILSRLSRIIYYNEDIKSKLNEFMYLHNMKKLKERKYVDEEAIGFVFFISLFVIAHYIYDMYTLSEVMSNAMGSYILYKLIAKLEK